VVIEKNCEVIFAVTLRLVFCMMIVPLICGMTALFGVT
jgi:hypothetical protein